MITSLAVKSVADDIVWDGKSVNTLGCRLAWGDAVTVFISL